MPNTVRLHRVLATSPEKVYRAFLEADALAGEALGYDRYLKSNTTKRRTHSLFRQGSMLYDLIPTMPEPRLLPLIKRFAAMLAELPIFPGTFGVV